MNREDETADNDDDNNEGDSFHYTRIYNISRIIDSSSSSSSTVVFFLLVVAASLL